MKIYEPADLAFYFEGDEFSEACYGYDPATKSVVPLPFPPGMRRVEVVNGQRLLLIVTLGAAIRPCDVTVPDDCIIVED